MSASEQPNLPAKGQLLVYRSEDGRTKLEVRLENETVWLTQQHLADLFQTSKQNIGQHLKNIFEEGKLTESSVVKNFFTTAADGKDYRTNFYNLDAIISVGYRVKSAVATRFRIWATQQLREFIVKGFVLDDERLPTTRPQRWTNVNSRGWQPTVIRLRGPRPRRGRTGCTTADTFNPCGVATVFQCGAVGHHPRLFTLNPSGIPARDLEQTHAGKISHEMAKELAEAEYDKFNRQRIQQGDAAGGEFEKAIKQLPPLPKRRRREPRSERNRAQIPQPPPDARPAAAASAVGAGQSSNELAYATPDKHRAHRRRHGQTGGF